MSTPRRPETHVQPSGSANKNNEALGRSISPTRVMLYRSKKPIQLTPNDRSVKPANSLNSANKKPRTSNTAKKSNALGKEASFTDHSKDDDKTESLNKKPLLGSERLHIIKLEELGKNEEHGNFSTNRFKELAILKKQNKNIVKSNRESDGLIKLLQSKTNKKISKRSKEKSERAKNNLVSSSLPINDNALPKENSGQLTFYQEVQYLLELSSNSSTPSLQKSKLSLPNVNYTKASNPTNNDTRPCNEITENNSLLADPSKEISLTTKAVTPMKRGLSLTLESINKVLFGASVDRSVKSSPCLANNLNQKVDAIALLSSSPKSSLSISKGNFNTPLSTLPKTDQGGSQKNFVDPKDCKNHSRPGISGEIKQPFLEIQEGKAVPPPTLATKLVADTSKLETRKQVSPEVNGDFSEKNDVTSEKTNTPLHLQTSSTVNLATKQIQSTTIAGNGEGDVEEATKESSEMIRSTNKVTDRPLERTSVIPRDVSNVENLLNVSNSFTNLKRSAINKEEALVNGSEVNPPSTKVTKKTITLPESTSQDEGSTRSFALENESSNTYEGANSCEISVQGLLNPDQSGQNNVIVQIPSSYTECFSPNATKTQKHDPKTNPKICNIPPSSTIENSIKPVIEKLEMQHSQSGNFPGMQVKEKHKSDHHSAGNAFPIQVGKNSSIQSSRSLELLRVQTENTNASNPMMIKSDPKSTFKLHKANGKQRIKNNREIREEKVNHESLDLVIQQVKPNFVQVTETKDSNKSTSKLEGQQADLIYSNFEVNSDQSISYSKVYDKEEAQTPPERSKHLLREIVPTGLSPSDSKKETLSVKNTSDGEGSSNGCKRAMENRNVTSSRRKMIKLSEKNETCQRTQQLLKDKSTPVVQTPISKFNIGHKDLENLLSSATTLSSVSSQPVSQDFETIDLHKSGVPCSRKVRNQKVGSHTVEQVSSSLSPSPQNLSSQKPPPNQIASNPFPSTDLKTQASLLFSPNKSTCSGSRELSIDGKTQNFEEIQPHINVTSSKNEKLATSVNQEAKSLNGHLESLQKSYAEIQSSLESSKRNDYQGTQKKSMKMEITTSADSAVEEEAEAEEAEEAEEEEGEEGEREGEEKAGEEEKKREEGRDNQKTLSLSNQSSILTNVRSDLKHTGTSIIPSTLATKSIACSSFTNTTEEMQHRTNSRSTSSVSVLSLDVGRSLRKTNHAIAREITRDFMTINRLNKATVINLVQKGIAEHVPLIENSQVTGSNDICNLKNYEFSPILFYQQLAKRGRLVYEKLDHDTYLTGSAKVGERSPDVLAKKITTALHFYEKPVSKKSFDTDETKLRENIKKSRVYFDNIYPQHDFEKTESELQAQRNRLKNSFRSLGATVWPYFDDSIDIVITDRELGLENQIKDSGILKIVQQRNTAIWNYEMASKFLADVDLSITGENTPFSPTLLAHLKDHRPMPKESGTSDIELFRSIEDVDTHDQHNVDKEYSTDDSINTSQRTFDNEKTSNSTRGFDIRKTSAREEKTPEVVELESLVFSLTQQIEKDEKQWNEKIRSRDHMITLISDEVMSNYLQISSLRGQLAEKEKKNNTLEVEVKKCHDALYEKDLTICKLSEDLEIEQRTSINNKAEVDLCKKEIADLKSIRKIKEAKITELYQRLLEREAKIEILQKTVNQGKREYLSFESPSG